MSERIAAGALVLLFGTAAIVLAAWDRPEGLPSGLGSLAERSGSGAPAPLGVAPLPSSAAAEISNRAPPSLEVLHQNPQLQAAYDAQAEAGEYVTPPAVSVPH